MSTPSYEPHDQQPTSQGPAASPAGRGYRPTADPSAADHGTAASDPSAQGYGPGYAQAPAGTAGDPAPGEPLAGTVVMRPDQQRQWATFAHLSPLVAGLLTIATGGLLWTGALGPLIIFLALKDRGSFVRGQAVEALNFQIVPTIIYVAGILFGVVTLSFGYLITVPILVLVGITVLVFQIIAAVKANRGVQYRYPLSWRLVR